MRFDFNKQKPNYVAMAAILNTLSTRIGIGQYLSYKVKVGSTNRVNYKTVRGHKTIKNYDNLNPKHRNNIPKCISITWV